MNRNKSLYAYDVKELPQKNRRALQRSPIVCSNQHKLNLYVLIKNITNV
jgi:hypothetical protein